MTQKKQRTLTRPGAKKGRKQRPLAPRDLVVKANNYVDPRVEMAKVYVPKGMHAFFGDRRKSAEYKEQGYEACTFNGEQVNHLGDPLWMISEEKHIAHREIGEAESISTLKSALSGTREEDQVKDSDGSVTRLRELED